LIVRKLSWCHNGTTEEEIPLKLFILLIFILIGKPAFSTNPPWAQNYIGSVSFSLEDDNHLRELQSSQRSQNNQVNQLNQQVKQQENLISTINQTIQTLNSDIANLNNIIASSNLKIQDLTRDTKQLLSAVKQEESKVPRLKSKIINLKQQIQTLKQKISQLENTQSNAKRSLQSAQQAYTQAYNRCTARGVPDCSSSREIMALKQKIVTAKNKLRIISNQLSDIKRDHQEQNSKLTTLKRKLQQSKSNITRYKQKISANSQAISNLKNAISNANLNLRAKVDLKKKEERKLSRERQTLTTIVNLRNRRLTELRQIESRLVTYRNLLIRDILQANQLGARTGHRDGHKDGQHLARSIGSRAGRVDGENDGRFNGRRDGSQRDYQLGYLEGERNGRTNGQIEGEEQGRREGRRSGNIIAATRDGKEAGHTRALNSDARRRGAKEGQKSGLEQSKIEGKERGTPLGEIKAIKKYEDVTLPVREIQGPFAGTFNQTYPTYPGSTRDSYNDYPPGSISKKVVKKAYRDGYKYSYHNQSYQAYYQFIEEFYNRHYDSYYRRSYDRAMEVFYQGEFDRGSNAGYQSTYNRVYQEEYNHWFSVIRERFSNNPDTNSSIYQQTFQSAEETSFRRKYEEIKQTAFLLAKEEAFNHNIEEQTNKYKLIRFNQVSRIYKGHPVLAYSSFSFKDQGISNIGSLDNIFQPGESIAYSIVLKNFGLATAKGAKITVGNKTVKLPNIPGQSIVKIISAQSSKVPSSMNPGDELKNKLTLKFKLSTEESIQGRHFYNKTTGQINPPVLHQVQVNYPLEINNFKLSRDVLLNDEQNISALIKNNSSRSYSGPLKLTITSDSRSKIIEKQFDIINELKLSKVVDDAKINIKDENDIFTPINLTLSLKKSGIILATTKVRKVMAKTKYIPKDTSPVILVNSENSFKQLINVIEDLNGMQNVSIIDYSLSKNLLPKKNFGLDKKNILVIDQKGDTIFSMKNLIENSKNSVLLFADLEKQGLKTALKSPLFRESVPLTIKVHKSDSPVDLVFTNPFVNSDIKSQIPAVQVSENLDELLPMIDLFKLDHGQYLKMTAKELSTNNFFDQSSPTSIWARILSVKIIAETFAIERAYELAPKRFLFWLKGKKWKNLIKKGSSLLMHKLHKDALSKDESLFQLLAQTTREHHSSLKKKDKIFKLTAKKMKKVGKKALKSLKKYDPGLANEINAARNIHNPFSL